MALDEESKAHVTEIQGMRDALWAALGLFAKHPCEDPQCVGDDCDGSIDKDNALIASCDLVVTIAHDNGLTFQQLVQGMFKLALLMGMPIGADVTPIPAPAPARAHARADHRGHAVTRRRRARR